MVMRCVGFGLVRLPVPQGQRLPDHPGACGRAQGPDLDWHEGSCMNTLIPLPIKSNMGTDILVCGMPRQSCPLQQPRK